MLTIKVSKPITEENELIVVQVMELACKLWGLEFTGNQQNGWVLDSDNREYYYALGQILNLVFGKFSDINFYTVKDVEDVQA